MWRRRSYSNQTCQRCSRSRTGRTAAGIQCSNRQQHKLTPGFSRSNCKRQCKKSRVFLASGELLLTVPVTRSCSSLGQRYSHHAEAWHITTILAASCRAGHFQHQQRQQQRARLGFRVCGPASQCGNAIRAGAAAHPTQKPVFVALQIHSRASSLHAVPALNLYMYPGPACNIPLAAAPHALPASPRACSPWPCPTA